jgi:hypothetical protein
MWIADRPIHHRIIQDSKHVSIVTCILSAVESPTPCLVISRREAAIREYHMPRDVRFGTECLKNVSCGYLRSVLCAYLNDPG